MKIRWGIIWMGWVERNKDSATTKKTDLETQKRFFSIERHLVPDDPILNFQVQREVGAFLAVRPPEAGGPRRRTPLGSCPSPPASRERRRERTQGRSTCQDPGPVKPEKKIIFGFGIWCKPVLEEEIRMQNMGTEAQLNFWVLETFKNILST